MVSLPDFEWKKENIEAKLNLFSIHFVDFFKPN